MTASNTILESLRPLQNFAYKRSYKNSFIDVYFFSNLYIPNCIDLHPD